jgi:hypothetical protein
MALNPFEQLELLVPEPRQAFEELATMLLQDCGKIDGRVAIYLGDGGVDAYRGTFSKSGQLTVYQCKYFTKVWDDSQKQKIRESFERAANSDDFTLREWFLCIPVRPRRQDLRWFDEWRRTKSVPIELVDGDDLTRMLEGASGPRTRQAFRNYGVFSVRHGFPVIQSRVRCIKRDPKTSQTFRLFVQLENRGDRTAEDIRVRLGHSPTQCVPVEPDPACWDDFGSGINNPRELKAKSDLHPGETVEIIQIPLVASTPFPFSISIEYWLRDQQSGRQFLVLQEPPHGNDETFDLRPGELSLSSDADGGFARSALSMPQDGCLEGLLKDMARHPKAVEFGLVDFGVDAVDPTRAIYRPHLAQSGMNRRMDRTSLTVALEKLVNLGWLDLPERIGKADRYRLSDAALANELFLYQVEHFKKLREQVS